MREMKRAERGEVTHHVCGFDFKPSKDVGELVTCCVDDAVHVECLVLVGLVPLSFVKRSLQHESTDVVSTEEPHDLLHHIPAFEF